VSSCSYRASVLDLSPQHSELPRGTPTSSCRQVKQFPPRLTVGVLALPILLAHKLAPQHSPLPHQLEMFCSTCVKPAEAPRAVTAIPTRACCLTSRSHQGNNALNQLTSVLPSQTLMNPCLSVAPNAVIKMLLMPCCVPTTTR